MIKLLKVGRLIEEVERQRTGDKLELGSRALLSAIRTLAREDYEDIVASNLTKYYVISVTREQVKAATQPQIIPSAKTRS